MPSRVRLIGARTFELDAEHALEVAAASMRWPVGLRVRSRFAVEPSLTSSV